jgi:hypothetical protein
MVSLMKNSSFNAHGLKFLQKYLQSGGIQNIGGIKISLPDKEFQCDHLLMIHLSADDSIRGDLADTYPPFKKFIGAKSAMGHELHQHEFALLNLLSKKILLFGLGRKCQVFMNDGESGSELSWDHANHLSASAVFRSQSSSANGLETYFDGDITGLARDFIAHVVSIGEKIREREYLPIVPYWIEEISSYEGKERADALEDQGVDEDEFVSIENDYRDIESTITNSLCFINQYFPDIDEGTLNSADFV